MPDDKPVGTRPAEAGRPESPPVPPSVPDARADAPVDPPADVPGAVRENGQTPVADGPVPVDRQPPEAPEANVPATPPPDDVPAGPDRPVPPDRPSGAPPEGSAGAPTAAGDGHPGGPPDSGRTDGGEVRGGGRRPEKHGSFLRELPVLLIIAFGLAVLIKTFLVQAFFIPSGSMEKTLHGCPGCSGDRVLVSKVMYKFRDPEPGDVVVFRAPEWAPETQVAEPSNVVQRALRAVASAVGVAPPGEKDFIKRVIAVGGQTVQCCDEQGRITVDDRPLDEPYIYVSDQEGYRPAPFGPVTVPEGRLWVMGDHRDQSADSRAHNWDD